MGRSMHKNKLRTYLTNKTRDRIMHGPKLFGIFVAFASKHNVSPGQPLAQEVAKPLELDEPFIGRRQLFQSMLVGGALAGAPLVSKALDMDAFINSELAADKDSCDPKKDRKCIKQLNADEALCQYGQSGNARGEACKRVKEKGGSLPGKSQGKSLGGAYAI